MSSVKELSQKLDKIKSVKKIKNVLIVVKKVQPMYALILEHSSVQDVLVSLGS